MVAERSQSMEKIEANITPEDKALLQWAAELEGCDLTEFVISTVQKEAHRVIERAQTLKLSREDSEAFVKDLLNPPEPNEQMKSAVQWYKEQQVLSE